MTKVKKTNKEQPKGTEVHSDLIKDYIETVSGTAYNKQDADEFIKDMHKHWETQMSVIVRPDGSKTSITVEDWQGLAYKTGELVDVSLSDIQGLLGEPNSNDDPDKVKYAWRFYVDDNPVNIWDWKGSSDKDSWSFYGHPTDVAKIFGDDHVVAS